MADNREFTKDLVLKAKYQHHPHQPARGRNQYRPEEVAQLTAEFEAKNRYLAERFEQLTPHDFCRYLFPEGSFEQFNGHEGDDSTKRRPNGIISIIKDDIKRGWTYNRVLFDDFAALDEVQGKEFAVFSPIAYSGRRRIMKLAYKIFGIVIDLDEVDLKCIGDLFHQAQNNIIPFPSAVVNSGTGLHIYYIFETPIPAYDRYFESLTKLKTALIDIVWNRYTSNLKKKQYQGIFQGYRVPGTQTKFSKNCLVTTFLTGKKITIHYLNEFVDKKDRALIDDLNYTSLEEAREMWPEWYERRIVKGEAVGNYELNERQKKRRRTWYNAWKHRLAMESYDGNRYFCVCVLFVYAMKAGIPIEEATKDALELVFWLDIKTARPGNSFTKEDVLDARRYYDKRFIKLGRRGILQMTNIDIGKTKRNGRTQKKHLERARAVQNVDYPNGEWRNKRGRPPWTNPGGRPDKYQIVVDWRIAHPNGRKIDCERETGLSRPTVLKWWKYVIFK